MESNQQANSGRSRIMNRLLYKLSNTLPCKIISDTDEPYLERYYLTTLFGVRIYLHRFVGSDPDRGLHDHPWAWGASLILSGWYMEESRSGTRKVQWFNAFTGDFFHRVVIPEGGPKEVWTLFAHRAGDVKAWGFMRQVGGAAQDTAFIWSRYIYPDRVKKLQWWRAAPLGKNEPLRLPCCS